MSKVGRGQVSYGGMSLLLNLIKLLIYVWVVCWLECGFVIGEEREEGEIYARLVLTEELILSTNSSNSLLSNPILMIVFISSSNIKK